MEAEQRTRPQSDVYLLTAGAALAPGAALVDPDGLLAFSHLPSTATQLPFDAQKSDFSQSALERAAQRPSFGMHRPPALHATDARQDASESAKHLPSLWAHLPTTKHSFWHCGARDTTPEASTLAEAVAGASSVFFPSSFLQPADTATKPTSTQATKLLMAGT